MACHSVGMASSDIPQSVCTRLVVAQKQLNALMVYNWYIKKKETRCFLKFVNSPEIYVLLILMNSEAAGESVMKRNSKSKAVMVLTNFSWNSLL